MKRFIAMTLLLVTLLGVFVSCKSKEEREHEELCMTQAEVHQFVQNRIVEPATGIWRCAGYENHLYTMIVSEYDNYEKRFKYGETVNRIPAKTIATNYYKITIATYDIYSLDSVEYPCAVRRSETESVNIYVDENGYVHMATLDIPYTDEKFPVIDTKRVLPLNECATYEPEVRDIKFYKDGTIEYKGLIYDIIEDYIITSGLYYKDEATKELGIHENSLTFGLRENRRIFEPVPRLKEN